MSKRVFTLHAIGLFSCAALFAQAPAILNNGTVNAADYSRAFAPGALISIFGSNLAPSTGGAVSVPLPTSLAGTSVFVTTGAITQSAPLFYVSPGQINAQLPYGLAPGTAQISVQSAVGMGNVDAITISARAPKIYTVDFSGQGPAVATDTDFNILTTSNPAKPAGNIVVFMNSLGATNLSVAAGGTAPGMDPGAQPALISDTVTATINGLPATVSFAGLTPGSVGLYQVNLSAPFLVVTGPVALVVTVGGVTSQANVTTAYRQLGFYSTILGGKAVAGQTLNGAAGASSVLAFRQDDALAWGSGGLDAWTKNTGLASTMSPVTGEALTILSGSAVIYDNNGIEDQSNASFYNNTGGTVDSSKPGLTTTFSMSNYFPLVFASDIKMAQAATITELIGYFSCDGAATLPFDNQNPYVQYRVNIWSNVFGEMPKETGGFTGDVFSSDSVGGTFTVSKTALSRISSVPANLPDPICRLDYKPATPISLAAGEYWFAHDVSIRSTPAATATSTTPALTLKELKSVMEMQTSSASAVPSKVDLLGKSLTYKESWRLPIAVEVRPEAISNQ